MSIMTYSRVRRRSTVVRNLGKLKCRGFGVDLKCFQRVTVRVAEGNHPIFGAKGQHVRLAPSGRYDALVVLAKYGYSPEETYHVSKRNEA